MINKELILGRCYVCGNRYYYKVTSLDTSSPETVRCVNFNLKWQEEDNDVIVEECETNLIFLDVCTEISLEQFRQALMDLAQTLVDRIIGEKYEQRVISLYRKVS